MNYNLIRWNRTYPWKISNTTNDVNNTNIVFQIIIFLLFHFFLNVNSNSIFYNGSSVISPLFMSAGVGYHHQDESVPVRFNVPKSSFFQQIHTNVPVVTLDNTCNSSRSNNVTIEQLQSIWLKMQTTHL